MSSILCSRWIQRWSSHPRALRQRSIRPMLEPLESRLTPAVFNVGPGDVTTLNADIKTANFNGQSNVINLSPSTYHLTQINNTWYGPNGLRDISSNLTIHGHGATIQRDSGAPFFRLFYVSGGMELPAGSLTMDNVTLQGGIAKGGNSDQGGGGLGAGGAIFNQGTLTLTDVTLDNNEALGGSSGIASTGNGGGGMGGDADSSGDGGGFGGGVGDFGGQFGLGDVGGGGGGGGFVIGANGANGTPTGGGAGGGLGGFGGGGGDGGAGGNGTSGGGNGGRCGNGGWAGGNSSAGGGGGGIGGGGGSGTAAGSGGFGGGGGGGGGSGGFGGGGGINGGLAGFGGGYGGNTSGGGGAGRGGAIFNMGADSAHPGSGQATLVNCTLTNNTAQGGSSFGDGQGGSGYGGALFNLDGHVILTNDTLAANIVAGGAGATLGSAAAGAVYNEAFGNDIDTGNAVTASLVLNNSIVATSSGGLWDLVSAANDGKGANAVTLSGSHNLVMSALVLSGLGPDVIALTANPHLGPLQNNGGPTPTMLPLPGSPVLGAGDPSLAPSSDQRGRPRPPNGPADLGSVQVSVAPTPPSRGGSGTPVSAGFFGLAIEEFELTVDSILALIEGALQMPHASLDATIAQLHTAINNDPLTPTFEGQLAILLGEIAAPNALSRS